MRIAVLSDIHANRQAFEAVLGEADRRGASRYVILGDIVGYGGDPGWCVQTCMALAEQGAIIIRGNHDQAVSDPLISLNDTARAAIDWTAGVLSHSEKAFLKDLPLEIREEDRLYVHADASAPQKFRYVTDTDDAAVHFSACQARLSFCGHVHVPALYALSAAGKPTAFAPHSSTGIPLLPQRRWLAVMGSVGQPRDGNPAAAFAMLDTETGELCFLRAAYDIEAAAASIRAAGLPDRLAARLFKGT
ncbi:metallophosphoesterase family protein [Agrobacterium sp. a22-2]|uniref:metallophosphoesterase family protein n=1 Tax=Agrobacterium sp. a22-2 TaxID=2283840 RepID=UPI0014452022|nr:metallophosphoesterase family protein [Agrobacterium sp. a22-2]NKN34917.1 metallophosphoesterase family protein [Agrobacterium sp. a22-2]